MPFDCRPAPRPRLTGHSSARRRCASRLLALAVVLCLAALTAAPAAAHAPLVKAEPAPGTELRQSPDRLVLTFAEPLDREQSRARIFRSDGREVAGVVSRPGQPSPVEMIVTLPEHLAPDVYTVSWFTLSAVDGHTRRGSYTLTVLEPDGTRPPAAAAPVRVPAPHRLPAWLDALGKVLALAGAVLLTGTAIFAVIAAPGRTEEAGSLRILRWQLTGGGGSGAALVIAGSIEQFASAAVPLGAWSVVPGLFGERFGLWTLIRLAAALCAAALLALEGARLTRDRRWRWGALSLAAVVLFSFSFLSHAAAGQGRAWGTIADVIHLGAASVWIGTLAQLAVALWAARPAFRQDPAARRLLQRFSTLAAVAVGLLLATGAVNALIEVPSAGAFVSTPYGRTLLVKLGLAAVLLVVAAGNAFYFRPRVVKGRDGRLPGFRRLVLVEVAAAVAVIAATGVLTVQTPARAALEQRELVARERTNVNPVNAFSGRALLGGQPVTLTLVPGRLGPNFVEAELESRIRPPSLTLTLEGPSGAVSRATLRPGIHGEDEAGTTYTGDIDVDGQPGTWTATLAVPDGAATRIAIGLESAPETAGQGGALASPAPQVPAAGWALLVVAAALGMVVLAWEPLSRRLSPVALGVAAGPAAIACIALAVAVGVAAQARPAGPAWATTTQVAPERRDGYASWRAPSRDGFLMIPAVAPDGRVWIGEMGINKLAGLDPATDTYVEFTFPINRLAVTMGAAADESNRIWLAQDGTHAIAVFDPATGAYQEYPTPTPDSSPFGITVDERGRVWFTEMGGHKLGVYDPGGGFTEYPLPDPTVYPYWLALAPDGRVWFTALTTGLVGVLDPATKEIHTMPVPDAGGTTGIAVAADGTVWFGIRGGKLARLDPKTGEITTFSVPDGDAYGVAVDRNGRVWVATTHTAVDAFDPDTHKFCSIPTGDGAWWVTAAPDGAVWVVEGAQSTNALGRISPERAAAPCG